MRLESAFALILAGLLVAVAGRSAQRPGDGPARVQQLAPLLLAVATLVAVVAGILQHPPLDEDDWYYLGAARWFNAHPDPVGLLTRYAMPREPIFRPVTFLWFFGGYALLGTHWWAWHLLSAALQGAIAWRTAQLARALGAPPPAATLAACLVMVHPALVESVVWINAQETQLLVLACLLGVDAAVRGRWALCALATLVALHTKEQGATLPALVVLARTASAWRERPLALAALRAGDAVRWVARAIGRPGVASAVVVVLGLLYRRLVLLEPDNAEHAAYLQQFMEVPLAARTAGLAAVASNLALPTVDGLGFAGMAWLVAALVATPLLSGAARLPRGLVALALTTAAAWALVATLPALADISRPTLDAPPGVTPDPNLRHLCLALTGPALVAGLLLAASPWRWTGTLAVGASAALFIVNTTPYERVGHRLVAGLEALSRPLGPEVAVRFVQPRDTVAAALSYGPWADPELPRLPVLVGEPRCGCARPPLPAVPGVSLRAFSEAFYSAHDSASANLSPGGRCRCERWRADARFIRLEGAETGPFHLIYER